MLDFKVNNEINGKSVLIIFNGVVQDKNYNSWNSNIIKKLHVGDNKIVLNKNDFISSVGYFFSVNDHRSIGGNQPVSANIGEQLSLYFLHIPKTAGTSFRIFLEDHYDLESICPCWLLDEILSIPPSILKKYKLVCGHFGSYIFDLLPDDVKIITILREPIDRTISHYLHIVNQHDHVFHKEVKSMSLDEFLNHPIGISEIMNSQTCWIAFDDLQSQHFSIPIYRSNSQLLMEKLGDRSLLEVAKTRLERFAFVGIAERLEESMEEVCRLMNWPTTKLTTRHNTSKTKLSREELEPRTIERIKALTELDRELYEFAQKIFDNRFIKNTIQNTRIAQDGLLFTFDKGLMGTGWLNREIISDEEVYRWTGPENKASIHLPLLRKNYKIFFRAGVYDPDLLRTIDLDVNGHRVNLNYHFISSLNESEAVFQGEIPKEIISDETTILNFGIEKCISPIDYDPNATDNRRLGIYFKWIDILPN